MANIYYMWGEGHLALGVVTSWKGESELTGNLGSQTRATLRATGRGRGQFLTCICKRRVT